MKIKMRHVRREKSGLFSYRRGVPADLSEYYGGRAFIVESLRTHDPILALNAAMTLADRDNRLWASLRPDRPLSPELAAADAKALAAILQRSHLKEAGPTFANAKDEYLKKPRSRQMLNEVTLAMNFAVEVIGDRPLSNIKRVDGKAILEAMGKMGWKTMTVRRRIAALSAIFSTGVLEYELELKNPFSSLAIPDLGADAKVVKPFNEEELRIIAAKCLENGEAGFISGLQLQTGLRVSEAAFLQISDTHLDAPIPFIDIRANVKRRLKNAASARKIPLVGMSLLAGQQAVAKAGTGSVWLFPELASKGSNVASKTVNFWLKETVGGEPHSHQARHSVETRLRNAGIHQGVVNAILGHAGNERVADAYFKSGYSLEVLAAALEKITLRCL